MASYAGRQYNMNASAGTTPGRLGATPVGNTTATGRVTAPKSEAVSKARRTAILVAAIVVAFMFMIVNGNSYITKLQQENNRLRNEISALQADIDSMNSQIVDETKISRIEQVATHQYGMVYPSPENCITISDKDETGTELAATIRAQAYN
ncbi:MAG: hypothetical protein KBS63_05830 [Clostridiales bacterium]|nr:hypothetical protein [Candidatus Crickella caballi]